MNLRQQIKSIIQANKSEILESREFFYKLDKYELNIHDLDNRGFFSVVLYPIDRKTDITNFSHWVTLNNLTI